MGIYTYEGDQRLALGDWQSSVWRGLGCLIIERDIDISTSSVQQ